jgi:hypothetical protein
MRRITILKTSEKVGFETSGLGNKIDVYILRSLKNKLLG